MTFSYSQEQVISWDEFKGIAKNISEIYNAPTYTLDIQYQTFKGKQSTKPFETANGFVQKSKGKEYAYIKGITSITTNKVKLTIDSNNKIVTINNGNQNINTQDVLDQYTQSEKLIKKITRNSIGRTKKYKLNYIDGSPISSIVLSINDKNELKSIFIRYTSPREYQDELGQVKTDYVSLKINYLRFYKKKVYKEIPLNNIISSLSKGGKLVDKYKAFKLIDFRLNN